MKTEFMAPFFRHQRVWKSQTYLNKMEIVVKHDLSERMKALQGSLISDTANSM